jgi:hypothetical protein
MHHLMPDVSREPDCRGEAAPVYWAGLIDKDVLQNVMTY